MKVFQHQVKKNLRTILVTVIVFGLMGFGVFTYAEEKTKDEETELKEAALNALLMMEGQDVIPVLEKILNNKDNPKLREKAMNLIKESKLKSNNKSQRGYNDD